MTLYDPSILARVLAKRNRLPTLLVGTLILAAALALPAGAQTPVKREVIYGVVRDSSGAVVRAPEIMITVGRTFQVIQAGGDSLGRFRVVVDSGSGDYLVTILATGFQSQRMRATLPAGSDSVELNVGLSRAAVATLEAVTVSASRPRAQNLDFSLWARGAAAEQLLSEGSTLLSAGDARDLNITVAMDPSVSVTSGGIGALGLGADQSRVTVNGLPTGVGLLPPGMRRYIRVGTTAYDPAIGGFSAANVEVELRNGTASSNPSLRLSHDGDLDGWGPGSLESVSGQRSVASWSASGEAIPGRMFYNAGFTASRQSRESAVLGSSLSAPLRQRGVSGGALDSLAAAATSRNVPFQSASQAGISSGTLDAIARFDLKKSPLGPIAMTIGGGYADGSQTPGTLQNETQLIGNRRMNGSLQFLSTRQTDGGWLLNWRMGGSLVDNRMAPSVGGPAFMVQVEADSSTEFYGGLGGAGTGVQSTTLGTLEASWQGERVVQLPVPGRHQMKFFAQMQANTLKTHEDASSGVFTYSTLDAFVNNEAQSYRRNLDASVRSTGAGNFAFGIGDYWRANRFLNLQLGLRADMGAAMGNVRADSGVRSFVPDGGNIMGSRFTPLLSPRLGFTWTYKKEKADPAFTTAGLVSTRAFPGNGQIRGGVGLFRSYWNVNELSQVARSLDGTVAPRVLYCGVGDAPQVPWFSDAASAPSACMGSFQTVTLASGAFLSPNAVPPAAWRGNLTVAHGLTKRLTVELGTVLSFGINQRALVDRNLVMTPAFTLGGEANRTSLRSANDIDPATGLPRADVNRIVAGRGSVLEYETAGRNRSQQLVVRVIPQLRNDWELRLSSAYTHTTQYTTGRNSAGSEPINEYRWSTTTDVPRFSSVLEFGRERTRWAFTGIARFDAGARYTPIISGDINGDGLAANDRAFVASEYLAGTIGMPSAAQDCLARQVGQIAGIGSCTQPASWRMDLGFTLLPDPMARVKRGGGRTSYTLRINNVTALLDRLVNSNSPKGWGGASYVDPVLASVRGFDPAAQTFLYAQNPNFGRTSRSTRARLAPYIVSIEAQIYLGKSLADQQAVRTLKQSRLSNSKASAVDSIVSRLRGTFQDPYLVVLQESDSLLLDRNQIEALYREQRILSARVDSVWRVAAEAFSASSPKLGSSEAGELLQRTYNDVISTLQKGVLPLNNILSEAQIKRLPGDPAALLKKRNPLFYFR